MSFDFYHAMVYVTDLAVSTDFYERLGMIIVQTYEDYARLRCPDGLGTIALHYEADRSVAAWGIRLYFEVDDLSGYCDTLAGRGIDIHDPPRTREWGWDHAYLLDPDGHEISFFSAGARRLEAGVV